MQNPICDSLLNQSLDVKFGQNISSYITKTWGEGEGTVDGTWTCPEDGVYFVNYLFTQANNAELPSYSLQLYLFTTDGQKLMMTSSGALDGKDWGGGMSSKNLSVLIPIKKGEKIAPYIHTPSAGVQMNITLYWIRLIQGHAS